MLLMPVEYRVSQMFNIGKPSISQVGTLGYCHSGC
jgi:hypothetical protein